MCGSSGGIHSSGGNIVCTSRSCRPCAGSGVEVRFADVVIEHVGYQDPALRQRKQERDLRLLERERAEQPDHPFKLFNLASVFIDQGKLAEAVPLIQRSLERSGPADSIVRKL